MLDSSCALIPQMPQDPKCLVVPELQWALQLAHITAGRQMALRRGTSILERHQQGSRQHKCQVGMQKVGLSRRVPGPFSVYRADAPGFCTLSVLN